MRIFFSLVLWGCIAASIAYFFWPDSTPAIDPVAENHKAVPTTTEQWRKEMDSKVIQRVSPSAAYQDGICRGQACPVARD